MFSKISSISTSSSNIDPKITIDSDFAQRQREIKKLKKQLLEERKNSGRHISFDQFALLHGDTFMGDRDSKNNIFLNLTYWEQLFNSWNDNYKFIDPLLSEQEIIRLQQDFKDIRLVEEILKNPNLRDSATQLIHAINQALDSNRRFVLPISMLGQHNTVEHGVVAIFTKEISGEVFCTLLDKEKGAKEQPLILTDTKLKYSYRSPLFQLDANQILNPNSPESLSFFIRLLKYNKEVCDDNVVPYFSKEIFSRFKAVALLREDKLPITEEDAITPQRARTSSMQQLKLILRSELEDQQKRHKVFFAIRFYSLLDGLSLHFKATQEVNDFRQALFGFGTFIQKLKEKNCISEQEVLFCEALQALANEKLSKVEQMTYVGFSELTIESNCVLVDEAKLPTLKGPQLTPVKKLQTSFDWSRIPQPSELRSYLEKVKRSGDSHYLFLLLSRLPPPQCNEKDYWSLIPQSDCETVNALLYEIGIRELNANLNSLNDGSPTKSEIWEHERIKKLAPFSTLITDKPLSTKFKDISEADKKIVAKQDVLLTYYLYAACHKLSLRNPDTMLQNFKIWVDFEKLEKNDDFFLSSSHEQNLYEALKKYFTEHNDQATGPMLYEMIKKGTGIARNCIHNIEDITKKYVAGKRRSVPSLLLGTLDYIWQFIPDKSGDNLHDTVMLKWTGLGFSFSFDRIREEDKLPADFFRLQHCAALASFERYNDISEFGAHLFTMGKHPFLYCAWRSNEIDPNNRPIFENPNLDSELALSQFLPKRGIPADENYTVALVKSPPSESNIVWGNKLLFEEFTLIRNTKSRHVVFFAILNLISARSELMRFPAVQQEVMRCLLKKVDYQKLLHKNPSAINDFRSIFAALSDRFLANPSHVQHGLFWLKLSYLIETRLHSAGESNAENEIINIQNKLSDLLASDEIPEEMRYETALLKIYSHTHEDSIDDATLADLAGIWVAASCYKGKSIKHASLIHLEHETALFMTYYGKSIKKLWKGENFFSTSFQWINRAAQLDPATPWTGKFPRFECQEASLNFRFNTIVKKTGQQKTGSTTIVRQQFQIEDSEANFEKIEVPFLIPGLPAILFSHFSWWKNTKENEFLLLDRDNKLFAQAVVKNDAVIVYRLNSDGTKQGQQLCKPTKLPTLLCDADESLFWEKEGEIHAVELPAYHLTFERSEKREGSTSLKGKESIEGTSAETRFYCRSHFSDFYLVTPTKMPHISRVLELENQFHEKRFILLPAGPSKKLSLFTEGKVRDQLYSESDLDLFYLMISLAESGDYLTAYTYLNSLNPHFIYQKDIIKVVLRLMNGQNQFNPHRSSFFLKLALHLIDNQSELTKEFFRKEHEPLPEGLLQLISLHYSFVLQIMSSETLNRFPTDLALTRNERKRVISYLYDHLNEQIENNILLLKEYYHIVEGQEEIPIQLHQKPRPFSDLRQLKEAILQDEDESFFYMSGYWEENSHSLQHDLIRAPREIRRFFFVYYQRLLTQGPLLNKMDRITWLSSFSQKTLSLDDAFFISLILRIAKDPSRFPPFPDKKLAQTDQERADELSELLKHVIEIAETISDSCDDLIEMPTRQDLIVLSSNHGIAPPDAKIDTVAIDDSAMKRPLEAIRKQFYKKEKISYLTSEFPIQAKIEEQPLKTVIDNLKVGHEQNLRRKVPFYEFQGDKLSQLETSLKDQKLSDEQKLARLKKEIEELANVGLEESDQPLSKKDLKQLPFARNERLSGRTERITLNNHLYGAFLHQDGSILKKHNSLLTQKRIERIFSKIGDYMLIVNRVDLIYEALQKLENGAHSETLHQELATLLDKKRHYDPKEKPLFLLYEYATGMMLRREQVDLFKWIETEKDENQRKQFICEFQAGGGKTKVISALEGFSAILAGKLPVFFSLPSLSDITKADLKESLSLIFSTKLHPLEIGLHTPITLENLSIIHEHLNTWLEEKGFLHMVPDAYHAIWLQYKYALKTKDIPRTEMFSKIINFFRKNAHFIIDEAHRTANSLEIARLAIGMTESLKHEEKELFILCYCALTGAITDPLRYDDEMFLHEKLQLLDNKQDLLKEEELKKILSILADYLVEQPILDIPKRYRKTVASYLKTKEKNPPTGIMLNPTCYLARGLISGILPLVLRMSHQYDYGRSLGDTEVEAPRFQKNPTLANFKNPEITSALSCQGLFQRGLDSTQMKKLVIRLLQQLSNDHSIEKKFERWQKGCKPIYSLDLDIKNEAYLNKLTQNIGKNKEVIEEYLSEILLPQVHIYIETLISTAPNLVSGGASSLLLTATVGLPEEYPDRTTPEEMEEGVSTVAYHSDYAFHAAVISRACAEVNREICSFTAKDRETRTAKDLFEMLWKHSEKDTNYFNDFGALIDVGAWNLDFSTEETAKAFQEFAEDKLNYDGVIYIAESLHLNEKNQIVLLEKVGENEYKKTPIHGSNLKKSDLKNLGLDQNCKLLKTYGPTQCTGTDLDIGPNEKLIVTVGSTTTFWHLIQAIMRARQFLKPVRHEKDLEHSQRIVWIIPNELKEKIEATQGEVTPLTIILWTLDKEAEQMKQRIPLRAMQGIVHVCEEWITNQMLEYEDDGETQIALSEKYAGALIEKKVRDLQSQYGNAETPQETRAVLQAFANEFVYKLAQIEKKDWEGSAEEAKVAALIEDAAKLVPMIVGHHGTKSNETAHMQQKSIQKEIEITKTVVAIANQKKQRPACLSHQYVEKFLNIPSLNDLRCNYISSANALFKTTVFPKELLIFRNVYQTFRDNKKEDQMKHSTFFLVVVENDKKYALPCSYTDASHFRYLLCKKKFPGNPNWKIALFTSEGILSQNSRDPTHALEDIFVDDNEVWFKEMQNFIAFSNGKVFDLAFLDARLSHWIKRLGPDAVATLIHDIQSRQHTKERMDSTTMQQLLARHCIIYREEQAKNTLKARTIALLKSLTCLSNGRLFKIAALFFLFATIGSCIACYYYPTGVAIKNTFVTNVFVLTLGFGTITTLFFLGLSLQLPPRIRKFLFA